MNLDLVKVTFTGLIEGLIDLSGIYWTLNLLLFHEENATLLCLPKEHEKITLVWLFQSLLIIQNTKERANHVKTNCMHSHCIILANFVILWSKFNLYYNTSTIAIHDTIFIIEHLSHSLASLYTTSKKKYSTSIPNMHKWKTLQQLQ